MYFETLEMNSGRQTETCTCHQIGASGEVTETVAIQSDLETAHGDSVTAAGAHQDLRDRTEERAADGEAGVGKGGTNGHPDPDTLTEGMIGIQAETDRGAEVETENQTGREKGAEIKTSIGPEVRRETVKTKIQTVTERGRSREARAERGKEASTAETGALRNMRKTGKPLMMAKHAGTTNSPKRARKNLKRSIKRGAVHLKG